LKIDYKKQNGFSLIELAFALLIMGIITAGVLSRYNIYIKDRQYNRTYTVLSDINSALQDYATTFGFYPCPSDQSASIGNSAYGKSVACTDLTPIPNCSVLGQGVCKTIGSPVVIIGGVPFKELHLNEKEVYDAWGGRITYALTATLRPLTSVLSPLPAGEIIVEQSDDVGSVITDAHYVLIASGPMGVGAFNKNGTVSRTCNLSQSEGENCDQDATFASDANSQWRNLVEGTDYFDDFVRYEQNVNAQEWNIEAATPDDLRFSYDRVGIGITDADPNTDLHVVGDIMVDDWAKADTVCNGDTDPATAECFDPEDIAGSKSGMRCDSNSSLFGDQAMIGIANEKVKCKLAIDPAAAIPAPCPTGYLAVGFLSTGELNCQLF